MNTFIRKVSSICQSVFRMRQISLIHDVLVLKWLQIQIQLSCDCPAFNFLRGRDSRARGTHNATWSTLTEHALYPVIRTPTPPRALYRALVIRERDFVPCNAGTARKLQAFLLERELSQAPLKPVQTGTRSQSTGRGSGKTYILHTSQSTRRGKGERFIE